jgi:hypothetical protein
MPYGDHAEQPELSLKGAALRRLVLRLVATLAILIPAEVVRSELGIARNWMPNLIANGLLIGVSVLVGMILVPIRPRSSN